MKILKKIIKYILIALMLLVFFAFGKYGFEIYKSYNEKRELNREKIRSDIQDSIIQSEELAEKYEKERIGDIDTNEINNNISNAKKKLTSTTKNKSIDKNSPLYNDYVYLLYDGKQSGSRVKDLIDRIIENSNQDLYRVVTITAKNIGNVNGSVDNSNLNQYIFTLENIKNSIDLNENYNISFGYNTLKTYINEIIIEKN